MINSAHVLGKMPVHVSFPFYKWYKARNSRVLLRDIMVVIARVEAYDPALCIDQTFPRLSDT